MFSAEAIIFAEYLQKQWSRLRNLFNLRKKYDNPAVETWGPEPIIQPITENDSQRRLPTG